MKGHNPFRSSFTAREARRRSRPRLTLAACIIAIAAGVALLSSGVPGSNASLPGSMGGQDLQLSETAKQQITALLEEKESRTPSQQKIDSQLLYALKAKAAKRE